jgi:hypothetical protein
VMHGGGPSIARQVQLTFSRVLDTEKSMLVFRSRSYSPVDPYEDGEKTLVKYFRTLCKVFLKRERLPGEPVDEG